MRQAQQLEHGVANPHEAVMEYNRWLAHLPSYYLTPGEMPIETALGLEHLIHKLGRQPFGESKKEHTAHVDRHKQLIEAQMSGH